MEDGAGQVSAPGGTDLYEARSIDEPEIHIICSYNNGHRVADIGDSHMRDHILAGIIILTIIVIGNLGGLWLVGAI